MRNYSVQYSDEAIADLDRIYSYIAFHFLEPGTARDITRTIRKEIRELAAFPEMYAKVSWEPWHSMGVRRLTVGGYNVYYLPEKDRELIEIVRIFYGGRDVEAIISEGALHQQAVDHLVTELERGERSAQTEADLLEEADIAKEFVEK